MKKIAVWFVAGLAVAAVGAALCLPCTFEGACTEYHDVSDLVGPDRDFATSVDLAEHLNAEFEPQGEHHGPCVLKGEIGAPTLIAWGSTAEHVRLRLALLRLRWR